MFTNTIDKKNTYINNDGIELVDLFKDDVVEQ